MNTSVKANNKNLSFESAPLTYADSLVGLAVGPFVSKIILGVENPSQQYNPSLQISMPTNALHDLARHVLAALQNADAQSKIAEGHKNYQISVSKEN